MGETTKPPHPAQAAAGHNVNPILDEAAAAIHAIHRRDVFETGSWLAKVHNACEHGQWLAWLKEEFGWSDDTARRYIDLYKLDAAKNRKLRNLKLRKSTLYDLADTYDPEDDPKDSDLDAVIAALEKAGEAAGKTLSCRDAERVMFLVGLRAEFGDYPDETLLALSRIDKEAKWAPAAIEELKQKRPETEATANEIVSNHLRAHLEIVFGEPLPAWLDCEGLGYLDSVDGRHRERVLKLLLAARRPLDGSKVRKLIFKVRSDAADKARGAGATGGTAGDGAAGAGDDAGDGGAGGDAGDGAGEDAGEDAGDEAGADSKDEIKRLRHRSAELEKNLAAAEKSKKDAYKKVDELLAEVEKLKGANAPQLTADFADKLAPPAPASGTKDLREQIAEDRKRIRAKAKQDRDEALWIGAVLRNEKRRFAVLDALVGALRNTASNTTSSATRNTTSSATANTESSVMGNDADPAESAEARKAHYVAGEDDEQQTGREDEEDEEDESEEEQPRRRPKLQEIKTTLDEALNDAFAELSELAGECRDLVDNAPPGIDQTQRIQTFDETASQLEEITDPPTVAPELADLPITYSVPRTRHSSRATRCWDACGAINACVEALESVAESDPRHQAASELASELQETVGSAENCEFPGMFG